MDEYGFSIYHGDLSLRICFRGTAEAVYDFLGAEESLCDAPEFVVHDRENGRLLDGDEFAREFVSQGHLSGLFDGVSSSEERDIRRIFREEFKRIRDEE